MKLNLTPTLVICGRHGEPFKHNWPVGYEAFVELAFDALNHDEVFAKQAKALVEEGTVLSVPAAAMHLLTQRPICCRLPPPVLLDVYNMSNEKANVWPLRRCVLCGRRRWGGPYRRACPHPAAAANDGTDTGSWLHVCLHCVAAV